MPYTVYLTPHIILYIPYTLPLYSNSNVMVEPLKKEKKKTECQLVLILNSTVSVMTWEARTAHFYIYPFQTKIPLSRPFISLCRCCQNKYIILRIRLQNLRLWLYERLLERGNLSQSMSTSIGFYEPAGSASFISNEILVQFLEKPTCKIVLIILNYVSASLFFFYIYIYITLPMQVSLTG